MRIRWTAQASLQVREAFSHLMETGSDLAAHKQVEAILRAVDQLSAFPEMGRPGRVENTRELVIQGTPFLVAYRLREDTIRILAVFHGARRWPTQF